MNRPSRLIAAALVLITALVVAACAGQVDVSVDDPFAVEAFADSQYVNGHLLVEPEWVDEHKDDERVVIVFIEGGGFDAYAEAHIPGAVYLDFGDIHGDPEAEVPGILINAEAFQEEARRLGINDDSVVVIYDEGRGNRSARLFYALELYGHADARILNGGFAAWQEAGLSTSAEIPSVSEGNFTANLRDELILDVDDVLALIDDPDVILFDARNVEQYTGEDQQRGAGAAGHIPTAVNLDWPTVLEEGDVPRWRSADEIASLYNEVGLDIDKQIIPYCQTNVRGAHAYFSLRVMGYNATPYEGSWVEWSNIEDLPVATSLEDQLDLAS